MLVVTACSYKIQVVLFGEKKRKIMITLEQTQKNSSRKIMSVYLLTAVHCMVFFGAVLSMAGSETDLLPLSAGTSLVALYPILCKGQKMIDRCGAILFGILILWILLGWSSWSNGGKILLNRIFASSADRQKYLYEMYDVKESGLMLFAGVTSAMVAGISGWMVSRTRMFSGILLPLVTAGMGAYFGLTPTWLWMMLLASASGLLLLADLETGKIIQLLVIAAILFGMVFLLLPEENPSLSEREEQWRDQMAQTTVADQQNPSSSSVKEDPQPEPEDAEDSPVMLRLEKSLNMKTILIILVILLILLLLFVPAVIKDRVQKRRDKNREGMYDENRSVAIRAVFRVGLLWMRASGITIPEESYYRLKELLNRDISENCAKEYEQILPIWQEAVFSDHTMTEEQWNTVLKFEQNMESFLMETASRWQRWKYRYIHAL